MRSAFLFLLALSFASGQKPATTSAMSPDVRKEILAFELNMPRADHLISALPLMSRFFMSQSPEILAAWGKLSVAKKIANLEKSPQAMANLKPYGLSAKEYIVGVPALRMAMWRAEGVPEGPKVFASPANLAFAKANLAQLKPKWEAVDGVPQPKK